MMHAFDTRIAELYGMKEAVLFENIYFWCLKNKANKKNYINGHYWTYNSVKAFSELFKYLSIRSIETGLKSLEEAGLIISGYHNKNKTDRTKWYAITEKGFAIHDNTECNSNLQNIQAHTTVNNEPIHTNCETYISQKDQMYITDINQIINTDIRETDKKIESPSFGESNFNYFNSVQDECFTETKKVYEKIHERWVSAGLPLSNASAQSYFTFSCRELKNALSVWSGMGVRPEELMPALENYIKLAELIKSGESWMDTVGNFSFFAKHFLEFLEGDFNLDKYKKRENKQDSNEAMDIDSIRKRNEELFAQWGIEG